MRIHNAFRLLILYLCLYALPIQPEGFLPGTLVKTLSGYSNIEDLKSCKVIPSFNPTNPQHNHCNTAIITYNTQSPADYYIKITIGDQTICCAADQKFYSYNQKKWLSAKQLTSHDLLMKDDGVAIAIDTIEIVPENCTLHMISLNKHHTYCVSHHNVVVHNAAPAIVVPFTMVVARVAPIAKTVFTAIGTYLGVHFAKKAAHKRSHIKDTDSNYSSTDYGDYYPDPGDPNNDKNKNNEHPHGIYKDVPYHHKNSGKYKSPCPDNGQHCLNYSLPTKTTQRIAMEGDQFVVLRQTLPGEYHGFKVSWEKLHRSLKQILIDHGFVKRSGKIIKQITEIWPS